MNLMLSVHMSNTMFYFRMVADNTTSDSMMMQKVNIFNKYFH